MPAMLDDPSAPTIYRTSGSAPFPDPHDTNPALPLDVYPRQVTLRDRVTVATIVPFASQNQVPPSLLAYLSDQFRKEVELGDTYPMIDSMPEEKFASYWFQNFGAVMLLGNLESADEVVEGKNWATECLGSYYIKPNYPGRSSHVCNAGFLVTDAARGRGVGRLLGESYLDWAPRLGYTYSVFNLVYETNVASCRIWDALGFKRIGRIKGAGNLKSYPGQFIDAIIYGRKLGPDGSDFVSEERFDKIKFYLKHKEYPLGADRAEKSRLRSAATHYKLLPDEDKLMLKGKEVISDPQKQYEIARATHGELHTGINKTTAIIADQYHWVRIKETVSLAIKNCESCTDLVKAPVVKPDSQVQLPRQATPEKQNVVDANIPSLPEQHHQHNHQQQHQQSQPSHLQHDFQQIQQHHQDHNSTSVSPQVLNPGLPPPPHSHISPIIHHQQHQPPISQMQLHHAESCTQSQSHSHSPPHMHSTTDYLQIDPQIMDYTHTPHSENAHFDTHHEHDTDSFQAMLRDRDADGVLEDDGGSGADGDINDMLMDPDEVEINVEGQSGDFTAVDGNHIGGHVHVSHNGTMDHPMGDKIHESHEDVMATARAAQEMILRAGIEGNVG
ncbi:hypothetical protein SBOR_3435 [Sclerotinia borealis F-4128]|uniref:N-acetyltransferase domain-containing protein n=1 Tax=Sclerotinia borealis (strain F-4128) TaxID=1432307 RepID=W9CNT1_SCLBF|nr:hypothetical protein SBOR_3435 [Sclerotinia borealis F-4128]